MKWGTSLEIVYKLDKPLLLFSGLQGNSGAGCFPVLSYCNMLRAIGSMGMGENGMVSTGILVISSSKPSILELRKHTIFVGVH